MNSVKGEINSALAIPFAATRKMVERGRGEGRIIIFLAIETLQEYMSGVKEEMNSAFLVSFTTTIRLQERGREHASILLIPIVAVMQ